MIGNPSALTAAAAERLLDAPHTGLSAEADPLARVIAAAAAPGRADERSGEEEAIRAFRLAREADVPATAVAIRPARRRPRWTWALLAKLIAVLLAATGAGWALAATTGVAPSPFWDPPAPPATTPGIPPSNRGPTSNNPQSSPSTGTPSAEASGASAGAPSPSASTDVPADIKGHCQAFIARDEDLSRLSAHSRDRLIEVAGGEENVPAYCYQVLGLPAPSPAPSAS
jgi:hypothetical protein